MAHNVSTKMRTKTKLPDLSQTKLALVFILVLGSNALYGGGRKKRRAPHHDPSLTWGGATDAVEEKDDDLTDILWWKHQRKTINYTEEIIVYEYSNNPATKKLAQRIEKADIVRLLTLYNNQLSLKYWSW